MNVGNAVRIPAPRLRIHLRPGALETIELAKRRNAIRQADKRALLNVGSAGRRWFRSGYRDGDGYEKARCRYGGCNRLRSARRRAADLPTKKEAPPAPPVNCFASIWTWLNSTAADCPLSWGPFTVYGTLDGGIGYESQRRALQRRVE